MAYLQSKQYIRLVHARHLDVMGFAGHEFQNLIDRGLVDDRIPVFGTVDVKGTAGYAEEGRACICFEPWETGQQIALVAFAFVELTRAVL